MRVRARIHDIRLPRQEPRKIARPEFVRLNYPDGTVDIGALCYLRRSPGTAGVAAEKRLVDLESLDTARRKDVRRLIDFLAEELDEPAKRPSSLLGDAITFVRFVDWTDSRALPSPFRDPNSARSSLAAYVDHLAERVRSNLLSQNTAAGYQNQVIRYLHDFMQIDSPASGIRTIQKSKRKARATEPPSDDKQAMVLSLSSAIFDGLGQLATQHIPYPFKLELPSFLKFPNDSTWIFPTARWMLHPKHYQNRAALPHPNWAYNYPEGRIANLDEIIGYSKRSIALRQIAAAEALIVAANTDNQHGRRRDAAILAHNAFAMLFVANTGMNWAQVRSLPWNDDYRVEASRQKFRSIKYRANGRIVTFTIAAIFLTTFKKFLELRTYLLNGQKHDRLFVGFGSNPTKYSLPQAMSPDALEKYLDTLTAFDPALPRVLTRKWRTAKVHALIPKTDISTAAQLIQTSEASLVQHYTAGSQPVANAEMSQFFAKMTAITRQGESSRDLTPTAVGNCPEVGAPQPIDDTATPIADCKTPAGCLFCTKNAIHADEVDTRKLVSARYVLMKLAPLGASKEHFDDQLAPLISRISALISRIAHEFQLEDMVRDIVMSVEQNGDLDSYWGAKLEMLVDLGVASFS